MNTNVLASASFFESSISHYQSRGNAAGDRDSGNSLSNLANALSKLGGGERAQRQDARAEVGRVMEQALQKGYEKLAEQFQTQNPISTNQGREYQQSPEAAADRIVGFIANKLATEAANGASPEELESFLEQGIEGFEKGFAEAEEIIDSLGARTETVTSDLADIKDNFYQGIDDLRETYFSDDAAEQDDGVPVAAAGSRGSALASASESFSYSSASSAVSNSFSFELTTQDGDTVSISLEASQLVELQRLQASGEQGSLSATRFSSSSDVNFMMSVEGELDEGELQALDDLFGQVTDLADTFFKGDVGAAFEQAVGLGFDDSEIAGFSLNLSHTSVRTAQQAYGQQSGASQVESPYRSLGSFAEKLTDAVATADKFANGRSLIKEMVTGLEQLRSDQLEQSRSFSDIASRLLDKLA